MKNNKDSLGDRMKNYENVTRNFLIKRMPVIVRVDGRAFHTLTKKYFKKGYDQNFTNCMKFAAEGIKKMSGCKLVYCQSDEISCLFTDWETFETQAIFDNNINKINSIAASTATSSFIYGANFYLNNFDYREVQFDSRAFNLPKEEVTNMFYWRQLDAMRNAVQLTARQYFSQKQLHKKSVCDIKVMLKEKSIDWEVDVPAIQRKGFCINETGVDIDIPVFKDEGRDYIERYL